MRISSFQPQLSTRSDVLSQVSSRSVFFHYSAPPFCSVLFFFRVALFSAANMGKSGPGKGHAGKRPFPSDGDKNSVSSEQSSSKKLLTSNIYSVLPEEGIEKHEKKEKLPPFYVRGFPKGFQSDINNLVSKGLKATIRLCTDGYKIIVPASDHYRAVEEYLKIIKAQYFTHDIAANKPYKAILRGLPDVDEEELLAALKEEKLQPLKIFKIRRNERHIYRDQLYLVHFQRGSTSIPELSKIRALCNIIIQWEKYKPKPRDTVQCSNCLYFGHGGKNCHLTPRCSSCGGEHHTGECSSPDENVKCVNCGEDHPSNSRSCPKRTDYVRFRQEIATRSRSQPKPKIGPTINETTFPALQTNLRRPIPVLAPLPLPQQTTTTSQRGRRENAQPPGFTTFTQASSHQGNNQLYSMEQLAFLFLELDRRTKACTTASEQVSVMMTFYFQHGQILAENR